jgi:hypothetical protein
VERQRFQGDWILGMNFLSGDEDEKNGLIGDSIGFYRYLRQGRWL